MSIKPIDMQTLFAKMDEVSKAQSHIKDQATLQQSQVGRAIVQQEIEDEHRVTQAQEGKDAAHVDEDESGNTGSESSGEEGEPQQEARPKHPRAVVTDPDVGQLIDIQG